ncbi:MAG: WYL domain-containing protein [Actinomycetes bacterium]
MPKTPGRDPVPAMERLVRLITVLSGSELGVQMTKLLEVVVAGGGDPDTKRRALDRDIKHLNNLGYDIRNVAPHGSHAVFRMFAHDNRLRVHLSPPQRAELMRAALEAGRGDLASHLDPDGGPAPGPPNGGSTSPQLDLAMRSAERHCLIRFTYKGTTRTVHPARVHSGPSGWYLTGREDEQDVVKEFVVSRMSEVALDAPFTADVADEVVRHSLDPLSWEIDPPVDVVLAVETEHVPLVENVLGSATRVSEVDGELHASYVVTHRDVFRWRVYELGSRVRVVSPESVRDEMAAELRAVVAARS